MGQLPTMPVGVDRYLADTAHLTLEEQGVHFRLQIYAWRSPGCCLPDDDARLARMLGISQKRWTTLKSAVTALWTRKDGTWVNDQVAREHEFVTGKIEKKRAAGKLGGRPKSLPDNDEGKASGSENGKQNESERKPATATATYTPVVPKGTQPDRFEEFRAAYPLRNVRFQATPARKRWLEALKRGADPEQIIAGAKSYAAEQARIGKAGTEFVKTAEVWLRNQLWNDYQPEPSAADAKQSGPDSYLAGLSDEDWRGHLRRWRSTGGQWTLANRTKPPDDPGTKVPAHLLAELGDVTLMARAG
jgi:uncharacterized protein YdaU (DUF1376 family)